jgi:quercetin dioxygenase-like cupin family protein/DNA-binding CsgD family transcriptional regulator
MTRKKNSSRKNASGWIGAGGLRDCQFGPKNAQQDRSGLMARTVKRARALPAPHALKVVPGASAGSIDERSKLPTSKAAFEALDAIHCGIVILNRRGQLVFANQPACMLLHAGDALQEREGELRAASPAAQPVLRAAIAAAIAPSGASAANAGNMFMVPRAGRLPIVAAAAPLVTSAVVDAGGILLLYDAEAPVQLSTALLHRLFGLTEAEAALCVALFQGYSVQEFAERRGVSRNTARTLLARAFAKTGKQRQSDLVRVLAALSSMQSLGTGFAAGMAAGLFGFEALRGQSPDLRLDSLLRADLQRFPNLEALVTLGEYAPGGSNKRHAHSDGLEIIYVLQGAISTAIDGEGVRITRAGEVLCIEADVVHQGRNASEIDGAKFVVVKLKRKGAAATVTIW